MIDIDSMITLDDHHEYVVVSKINYECHDYIYIVDTVDHSIFKFAEIHNENGQIFISEINDNETELISQLLPLFAEASNNYLENLGDTE